MPLSSGTRLGPYEIQSAIGAGGMGEVYRARDTRLDRTVAIKILPAELSADPDRRTRFEREAHAVAALSHPHICTLHDIGTHDGTTYLVMEYLAGESLAERLLHGPLPLAQALDIGAQIAEALDAAHKHSIIHRDLKPGNVMLTGGGSGRSGVASAKLLDFGLAKLAAHGERPALAGGASVPTQAAPVTTEGTVLGTLQYMAPEQLEGKEADARTDLWALGAVLYEMVTGKRAFEGESHVSLIGNILHAEPAALATVQPLTPPALDRVVKKCLAKHPDDRWDTAHDVADELRWILQATGTGSSSDSGRAPRRGMLRWALAAVAGLALAGAGAGLMWLMGPARGRDTAVIRTSLDIRPAEDLNASSVDPMPNFIVGGSRTAFCWTSDGRALVFVGRRGGTQQLYVRPLAGDEARPLAGTEGARVPAVSVDGQWVAFWAGGAIKKVPLAGGPVVPIASGVNAPPIGLTWDDRGTLYFGAGTEIWKVQDGGDAVQVSRLAEDETLHGLPWVLPGGRILLYTASKRSWTSGDEAIVAQTLATGARTVLVRDAADARYVQTGHLVFLREGVLFAVPFDVRTMTVRGQEVPLLAGVAQAARANSAADVSLAGQFAIASSGTLAWLRGSLGEGRESVLVAVDRRGQVSPLNVPVQTYGLRTRLAPNGRELAMSVGELHGVSIWKYDLVRGTLTPVLQDGEASIPIWTRDGQRLVFFWNKEGRRSLAWRRADGTAPPDVLVAGSFMPSSWAPDGKQLAAYNNADGTVAIVRQERGQATVESVPQVPSPAGWPEFSPDGRWLAYGSSVSGRGEVYIQPYPGPGEGAQVSVAGGGYPAWRGDGRALFFVGPGRSPNTRQMMEVDVQPGPPLRLGTPKPLFEFTFGDLLFTSTQVRAYDVTPDGRQFFVFQERPRPPMAPVTHVNLIQNWFEELKAKVPANR